MPEPTRDDVRRRPAVTPRPPSGGGQLSFYSFGCAVCRSQFALAVRSRSLRVDSLSLCTTPFTPGEPRNLGGEDRRLDRLWQIAVDLRQQAAHVVISSAHRGQRQRRNPAAAVRFERLDFPDQRIGITLRRERIAD